MNDTRNTKEKGPSHLMDLVGLGKEIWEDEDIIEYVKRLKNEWDDDYE